MTLLIQAPHIYVFLIDVKGGQLMRMGPYNIKTGVRDETFAPRGSRGPADGVSLGPVQIARYVRGQDSVLSQIARISKHSFDKACSWAGPGVPCQISLEVVAKKKSMLLFWASYQGDCKLVVGFIVCSIKSLVLHIANIAVGSKWRRQGVAKCLIQEALNVAKARHLLQVTLHVEEVNHPARSLMHHKVLQRMACCITTMGRTGTL
eukprot:jgi/Botrbrau1/7383/Bobra.0316s0026.1